MLILSIFEYDCMQMIQHQNEKKERNGEKKKKKRKEEKKKRIRRGTVYGRTRPCKFSPEGCKMLCADV